MLRHPTLIPLSHQHQHGLALCVRIERGLRGGGSPQKIGELARRVGDTYEVELRNHFEVEEKILFPAIVKGLGPAPLVEELIAEHRKMEKQIAAIGAADPGREQRERLLKFAAALSTHIRREERELFEDIQKRLPLKTMDALASAIDEAVVRVCL